MTFLQEYPIITRYVIGKKTIWLGLLTLHMNFYPVRPKGSYFGQKMIDHVNNPRYDSYLWLIHYLDRHADCIIESFELIFLLVQN